MLSINDKKLRLTQEDVFRTGFSGHIRRPRPSEAVGVSLAFSTLRGRWTNENGFVRIVQI